jgi:hypothetical protein
MTAIRPGWCLVAGALALPVPTLAFVALALSVAESGRGGPSPLSLLPLGAAGALTATAWICLRYAGFPSVLARIGCLLGLGIASVGVSLLALGVLRAGA